MDSLLNQTHVYSKIHNLRGVQVMIDRDLAELYGVETKYLKRQVQRNIERFNEDDFMFVLTKNEFDDLRRQIGTANFSKTRALPYAFTEQGTYMLATVINSTTAVEVSKSIMRTFTKLRAFSKHYKNNRGRLLLIIPLLYTPSILRHPCYNGIKYLWGLFWSILHFFLPLLLLLPFCLW